LDFIVTPTLWQLDELRGLNQRRRKVRVLVHRAFFTSWPNPNPHYFIKVTNLSREREVEITHVWFQAEPRRNVLNPHRPLPKRLKLDEAVGDLDRGERGATDSASRACRPRLALIRGTIKSRLNRNVPPEGFVAEGGVPGLD
jgi:hypothetical protein